ncbi:MAG TPA: uroporphyrinogen decarboxylase [Stellaceae bacterium]|nr:uroporphyrinogen decarboxylase [Stellaceae bacterium]
MPGEKTLLRALAGETLTPPPIWLMRQAGRYLAEYRALRERAPNFLTFCLTPELAAEATLQPVQRFGLDAAILFSDILVVPYALGQRVDFSAGEGPRLDPVRDNRAVEALRSDNVVQSLAPVFETIRCIKAALDRSVALIGFAGSPWTVATYMIEGGSSRDFAFAKRYAYADPSGFSVLIDRLVRATVDYLAAQVAAGVEVVQLFDSWAGVLPQAAFQRWVIDPTSAIVTALHRRCPGIPIIGFPRGAGLMAEEYLRATGVDAISLDSTMPLEWARDHVQVFRPVQGNLDPVHLLAGGAAMEEATRAILSVLGKGPLVFNLGHGILPETPPEHVEALVTEVRRSARSG